MHNQTIDAISATPVSASLEGTRAAVARLTVNRVGYDFAIQISGIRQDWRFSKRAVGLLAKRMLDIVGAAFLLLLVAPLAIPIALQIRRDGGPIFYRHERRGLGGRTFGCLKFRSMQIDADQRLAELLASDPAAAAEWRETHKLRNDPRITRVGQFLRATSLDELPQLVNVLRGEMSLVGPRPIVQSELSRYGHHIDTFLSVKPGMTGLWQVSGRSDLGYRDRVGLDTHYIENRTFWLDILILLRTIPAVLCRRGAV